MTGTYPALRSDMGALEQKRHSYSFTGETIRFQYFSEMRMMIRPAGLIDRKFTDKLFVTKGFL